MLNQIYSSPNQSSYFSPCSFSASAHLANDWRLLHEAVLALPRSAVKERLLFFIEEGSRLSGKEAVNLMRQIILTFCPLAKRASISIEMQKAIYQLLCYLNQLSLDTRNHYF